MASSCLRPVIVLSSWCRRGVVVFDGDVMVVVMVMCWRSFGGKVYKGSCKVHERETSAPKHDAKMHTTGSTGLL